MSRINNTNSCMWTDLRKLIESIPVWRDDLFTAGLFIYIVKSTPSIFKRIDGLFVFPKYPATRE